MSEPYDDFDRALLRAGKRAAAPSNLRARALSAAAAAGVTTAATTSANAAAAAAKAGGLAKALKLGAALKWTFVAAVTTASVGTAAVYVHETETRAPEVSVPAVATGPSPATTAAVVLAPASTPAPAVPETAPIEEPSIAMKSAPPAAPTAAPKVARALPSATPDATDERPVEKPIDRPIDPLREELGLVDGAGRALARGDATTAIRLADEHATRFSSGALAVERDVIRIDALAAAGRRAEAAAHAREFVARHPSSAQATRIAKIARSTETNP